MNELSKELLVFLFIYSLQIYKPLYLSDFPEEQIMTPELSVEHTMTEIFFQNYRIPIRDITFNVNEASAANFGLAANFFKTIYCVCALQCY